MISIPADVLFEEEKNLVFNRQDRNEKAVKYFYTKRRQKKSKTNNCHAGENGLILTFTLLLFHLVGCADDIFLLL